MRFNKILAKSTNSKSSIRVLLNIIVFLPLLGSAAYSNNTIILTDNGQAKFAIIQSAQASKVEKKAISELADYLQRISGAQFEIRNHKNELPAIIVGTRNQSIIKGSFSHLQTRDSFSIKTKRDANGQVDIYLVGCDSIATAFAIYTFLEDLGCRWFMPGKIGEVIPKVTRLEWIVRERSEQPDFPFRQIWWAYGGPKETAEAFEMWKLHNKVAFPQIRHGHNLTSTLPPKKFFDNHPEYYALVDGKRQTTQLCTSNPEVIRLVIDRINQFYDEYPEVEAYSLCPDDNTDFCECDKCQALDVGGMDTFISGKPIVTDRYIHFLNEVAQGIQKRHPGKKVSTYAYVNYSKPPLREKIDPNVVIVLTSSVYCSAHGIGDLNCSSRQEMKQDLAGWTAAAQEVYIYDYDPTPYNAELSWPLFGARYREMSDYLAMGIRGFSFESHNSWATLAPNFYVAAKTMWNANLDFEALLDDYSNNFFAESARPMAIYYQTIENALRETPEMVEWGQLLYPRIFTKEVISQCRKLIDKASQSAQSEAVRERVNAVALGFEYLENYIHIRNAASQKLSFDAFKKKYDRCRNIIDRLYQMNKDYILHDVALDYLNRGLGKIATTGFAADLGLVTDWMVIGSFDNTAGEGQDRIYPPEKKINYAEQYRAFGGEKVRWKEHHNPEYLGKIDLLTVFNHIGFVSAYAVVVVESSEKREVQLRVGSNDQVKMWLNGEEVWNWNNPSGRLVQLDEDIVPATLPAGKSQIMLKISNMGGNWGFCFRITDEQGNSIPDLSYSLH